MDPANDVFIKTNFPDADVKNSKEIQGHERVIGGMDVESPVPWFVFLQVQSGRAGQTFRCGASLINARWAVTAAHCICNEVTISFLETITF